jgi:hypothetical protein
MPTLLAAVPPPSSAGAESLAWDGKYVFWGDATSIWQVFTTGGAPIQVASGLSAPGPVAANAVNVYWAESTSGIMSAPLGGGSVVTLASGQWSPDGTSQGLALGSGIVALAWGGHGLVQVPLGGGSADVIMDPGSPQAVAIDGSTLYWTQNGFNAGLAKAPINGTASMVTSLAIHGSPANEAGIAVDATDIYWSQDTSILKMAK